MRWARDKVFTEEFLAQWSAEHREMFDNEPEVGGWPDSGEGQYATKLTLKEWYDMNNCQRVYQNFVE